MKVKKLLYNEVVTDLNQTANDICNKYDELAKIGRRILKYTDSY